MWVVLMLVLAVGFRGPLTALVSFAAIGYALTLHLVPRLGPAFARAGLSGVDLAKRNRTAIPEAMGVVAAVTYVVLLILIIPFVFFKYLVLFSALSNHTDMTATYQHQYLLGTGLFPHNKLAEFLSGVLCLLGTILLGVFDDLFDIRWRHKFFLPAVASLPLLIVYYVDFSVTAVVVPPVVSSFGPGRLAIDVLRRTFDTINAAVLWSTGLSFTTLAKHDENTHLLDLGVLYYAYMSALSIFAPNSINILAGINGLEVGQLVVLGTVFLINDLCYLSTPSVSLAAYDSHLLSAIFLLPFLGVSLGLLRYNFYPARVFVGDTYCYFSGMVFAIVGILGHFSKTLLIFLLPQIINFVYSVPQLFGIVPCPRHRVPTYDPETDLLSPSFGQVKLGAGLALVRLLSFFKLIAIKEENGSVYFSNMTILNLVLVRCGPMREPTLCITILLLQFAIGVAMICIRHTVGPWLFGFDNLTWGVK